MLSIKPSHKDYVDRLLVLKHDIVNDFKHFHRIVYLNLKYQKTALRSGNPRTIKEPIRKGDLKLISEYAKKAYSRWKFPNG